MSGGADSALKEAYQRINYALTCDKKELYQEAYRNYLATTTYISNVLGLRSSGEVWCDENTLKLLDLAKMCIEAAARINSTVLEKNTEGVTQEPAAVQSDLPTSASATSRISESDQLFDENNPDDLFSILDSLPDVPANKPGKKYKAPIKKSATLPVLPKAIPPNDPPKTLPRNLPNNNIPTRSRSVYIPPVSNETTYFSSPLGTNLGGTMGNPVVLKVSPLDRAKQQNAVLAAKYERRAQRGMLRPRDRLELIRAQEENLMIARELEKTLARKSEQRKQRLEMEQAAQEDSVEQTIGTFEAILYCKIEHINKLIAEAKHYDISYRTWPTIDGDEHAINRMERILVWCFGESAHPMNKAIGEAQFNFYNRLAPLNKKMYLSSVEERAALLPGIVAELEGVTHDVTDYLRNLTLVYIKLYPMFHCESGLLMIQTKLSDLFFTPFLQLLHELYALVHHADLAALKHYLQNHSQDDITSYPEIKTKYHLGEAPYSPAISALREIRETSSPLKKLALLVSFGQLIASSIHEYYLQTGHSEEEAGDASCMGADDLMPITIYIITRANIPELLTELHVLLDITHDEDLMGSEGYCLTTVQHAISYIVEEEKEKGKCGARAADPGPTE